MKIDMRLFNRNGVWYVEIVRGKNVSLKTKDEDRALNLFREMEAEHLRGRLIKLENVKKITLDQFKKLYGEEGRDGISPHSIKKDMLSLKLLADVIGGSTQLRAIDDKIEDFKTICRARGTKNLTVNGYLRHIKAAFRWAAKPKQKYLSKVPEIAFYRIRKSEKQQKFERILMPDEIETFLAKALETNIEIWRASTLSLWTGGRRREVWNLIWPRVNFKRDQLTLEGKTGPRTVPMLPPVREMLEPIKKDIGRVFPDWHPDTVSHRFKLIAISSGIPDHRLHDLRHTSATYMLKSGIPIETVQEIMGHADISTTRIYAQVLMDMMKNQMSKLRFE